MAYGDGWLAGDEDQEGSPPEKVRGGLLAETMLPPDIGQSDGPGSSGTGPLLSAGNGPLSGLLASNDKNSRLLPANPDQGAALPPKPFTVTGPDGKPVTTGEVELIVRLARQHLPKHFPENPASVQFINDLQGLDGEPKQGETDFDNKMKLDTASHGRDPHTPTIDENAHDFIQTVLHEMIHVNQNLLEKIVARIPFVHSSQDRLAGAIADNIEDDFLKQRKLPNAAKSQRGD